MNLFLFITVRWLDILDIALVAFFISYFYTLVRGTVAMKILIGLLVVLIFWKTTKALQMELVADLIETFIGVGSIAFVIIFQPELRKFLIRIGSNQIAFDLSAKGWFRFSKKESVDASSISQITVAVDNMSQTKTGAIIVIERDSDLEAIATTGTQINAEISTELLTSIFFKNNALHDGAVIISNERILAAGCILPNSDRKDLPKSFGLRHRAVLGLSESSNAFIILVSEETGKIMTAYQNTFTENIQLDALQTQLNKILLTD